MSKSRSTADIKAQNRQLIYHFVRDNEPVSKQDIVVRLELSLPTVTQNLQYLEKSFVTVDGISMEHGYSIVNHRQIPLYQHLLNHSKEFYLLADGHKFNKRYYSRLWSIQRVQNLVTDNSVDEKYIKYFHNAGIHCYCDR